MNKINVAIVGFGLSGRVFHSSLLKACPEYEITKVFTSRVDEVKELLPSAVVVSDINEIFNDATIDLVILCGPNYTHYEQSKRALLSNKHVVVEKPFVIDSNDGQELIDMAKERELILTVFHNRRWDGDFLTIEKLIEEDQLGDIQQFNSHFDRWRPHIRDNKWKEKPGEGTGIYFDLGVHLIDQCIELFGHPKEVFADLEDQKANEGVIDYFHVILKYEKMRAVLHSSSFSLNNPRFSVLGNKGNYIKSGLDPQEEKMVKGLSPAQDHFGSEDEKSYGVLITESTKEKISTLPGEYLTFYKKLALAIQTKCYSDIPVTPESALSVIKVLEASIESSKEGKWINFNR
jgi:scyllo-inositol 2-dehydrogenase (NADP+)